MTDMGLLTLHNGTLNSGDILSWGDVSPSAAEVNWYQYGNLGRVSRAMTVNTCIECGKQFRVQLTRSDDIGLCHSCRTITVNCDNCQNNFMVKRSDMRNGYHCPYCGHEFSDYGKRGQVIGLSRDSKRRLMRKLSSIDVRHYMSFASLTFPTLPADKRDNPEYWRLCLRRFEARFRRRFPRCVFIWRLELVTRKSGEDTGSTYPHYHCLVLGTGAGTLRKWISQAWYECVGSGDIRHLAAGTNVKNVRSKRGIIRYASKSMSAELGKNIQTIPEAIGRLWGIACQWDKSGHDFFQRFISPITRVMLNDEDAARILFRFRKMINAPILPYTSLSCYIGDGLMKKIILEQCAVLVE